jgi:hypothetical protein
MWCRLCATQRTPPRYARSMPQPAHTPGLAPFALTWPAEAVTRWPARYRRKIRHPADGLETSLRRMSTQRRGGRRGLAVYGGLPEVRSPRSDDCQLGRLAARSCREDSPESSSESCSESDLRSDVEDCGLSSFGGNGGRTSARNGQGNLDSYGQNCRPSCTDRSVPSHPGNP